jgi:hypothetical protein
MVNNIVFFSFSKISTGEDEHFFEFIGTCGSACGLLISKMKSARKAKVFTHGGILGLDPVLYIRYQSLFRLNLIGMNDKIF